MLPLLVVSTALSVASCPAQAEARASAAYQTLDYVAAAAAVEGLERCLDGTPDELAGALRWRAQALFALERQQEALDAFVLLATVLPTWQLDPMLSPRLHELFRTARVRVLQGQFVFARLKAPRRGEVEVEVFGPEGAYDEVLVEQRPGKSVVAAWVDTTWRASRAPEARSARVMLRLKGKTVLQGPEVPLPVLAPGAVGAEPLDSAPPAGRATSPWLWLGVGAVAAIAVVAVGVAVGVSQKGPGRVEGSLGALELP